MASEQFEIGAFAATHMVAEMCRRATEVQQYVRRRVAGSGARCKEEGDDVEVEVEEEEEGEDDTGAWLVGLSDQGALQIAERQ